MGRPISPDQHAYLQVAGILRGEIHYGGLKDKVPSIRDLALRFGINFKTANRAVSLLVDEGLVYRVKGKGTYCAPPDASTEPGLLLGVVLPDITNPNFARLAQSIQEQAHRRNMSVLVYATSGSRARLREILADYRRRKVSAVIAQGGAIRTAECRRMLRALDVPVIGDHTHETEIDDVWIDVRAGAQMVVSHLLEACGGPVAYVSGSDESVVKTGRFLGYRDALLGAGERVDMRMVAVAAPSYRGGFEASRTLLAGPAQFRSIFLYNLVMAMGANSAITSRGLSIPGQLAVAGCDDSVDVGEMIVPTTTVSFDYAEEARQLLMLAVRRIKNPSAAPMSIRVAPRLVVRQSTLPGQRRERTNGRGAARRR
jgi:LacI family transcriptional regulator